MSNSYESILKQKILKLIEYYYKKENKLFEEEVINIGKVFDEHGDYQLTEYILAQHPECKNTWVPM